MGCLATVFLSFSGIYSRHFIIPPRRLIEGCYWTKMRRSDAPCRHPRLQVVKLSCPRFSAFFSSTSLLPFSSSPSSSSSFFSSSLSFPRVSVWSESIPSNYIHINSSSGEGSWDLPTRLTYSVLSFLTPFHLARYAWTGGRP